MNQKSTKIGIFGLGYVGLANLLIFSKNFKTYIYDTNKNKNYDFVKNFILSNNLDAAILRNIVFASSEDEVIEKVNFAIICLPSDFNDKKNELDINEIVNLVEIIKHNNDETNIIIRSTISLKFTKQIKNLKNIYFVPEFLRETNLINDSRKPDRLVIGYDEPSNIEAVKSLFELSCETSNIILTSINEAIAIKLLSNTYLALRVSFFNEVDSFALDQGMNPRNIIDGICSDSRIGNHYNNPSFGFGGYCLPKDTKQLAQEVTLENGLLLRQIYLSNDNRINYIANQILSKNISAIGVYRLQMKKDSLNFRESSTIKVIQKLSIISKVKVIIFEPLLNVNKFEEFNINNDFKSFVEESDIILCNRVDDQISSFKNKIFTRDIFEEN